MRKRILLSVIISMSLLFSFNTYGMQSDKSDLKQNSDISYSITIIEPAIDNNSDFEKSGVKSRHTVSKTKKTTYYSKSNTALWSVSVKGSFTYGDGTAICNSSSCITNVYNDAWKISNTSASKSGASATAKATGKQYYAGVAINTVNKTVTLTCDKNGNFK